MVARICQTLTHEASRLTYTDACRIAQEAGMGSTAGVICLQFEDVEKTTTAALARLVVLRRDLLRNGRDLRIAGLRNQANSLYEITGMTNVLPRQPWSGPQGYRDLSGKGIRQ